MRTGYAVIRDAEVPEGVLPQDYARRTIPSQLAVEMSKIPGAGEGVWTREALAKGVRFGPFRGDTAPVDGEVNSYSWVLTKRGRPCSVVDAQDPSKSNWMRYVNCARSAEEQNLHAYQRCGRLFYKTTCDVFPHTELLVWYGGAYAEELGIDVNGVPPESRALVGKFPCYACDLCFVSPLLLDQHVRAKRCAHALNQRMKSRRAPSRKYSKKRNKCVVSPRASAQARGLVTSPGDVSDGGGLFFPCDMCGALFKSARGVRDHKVLHSAAKPFACKTCHATFRRIQNLHEHVRIHSGDKPFGCSRCKAYFTQSSSLKRHERSHSGEKRYSCVTCGSVFVSSDNLRLHQRTHSRKKPFRCSECDARFAHSGKLREHKRTHTGEKPFKCTVCDKMFAHKSSLSDHHRTHSGEKPYRCRVCDNAFAQSGTLKNHMRSHTRPTYPNMPLA